jgi:glycosyltransferase involved in cell wall biosynthesis
MRILQIPDCPWSIGQLCAGIRKFNPQIDWRVQYVPPRDIFENIMRIEEMLDGVDLIDFQYWNSARQLVNLIPALEKIPKILTHHNQKHLLAEDWSDFDLLCCKTDYAANVLNTKYQGKVVKIENCPDHSLFKWIGQDPVKPVVGYCGRVVPWKNLKEVARACYELGYPLKMMGSYDKKDYWDSIPQEYKAIMDFTHWQCNNNDRPNFYKDITIYVGFSSDGREEGTLPFLEALACGVPVVTTSNGMAADIVTDDDVMLVEFDNYENLKMAIKKLMEDAQLREKLRENGWRAVRQFTHERMARDYERVYNKVLYKWQTPVSVIIPATYERYDLVKKIIASLEEQTYKNVEAVIVWDEEEKKMSISSQKITVKNVYTYAKGYNLAMARNLGLIESIGDIIVFCDSRLLPASDAVQAFVDAILKTDDRVWFFGDKGGQKPTFVENFSAIRREYIVRGGMFNERITSYGGMSQELRDRFSFGKFKMTYLGEAKASELKKSKLTPQRREDIINMKNLLYKLK